MRKRLQDIMFEIGYILEAYNSVCCRSFGAYIERKTAGTGAEQLIVSRG